MAGKNETAAQIMEHLCNHDWHGYSQVLRWGDGEGTETLSIDGKTYIIEQGDRDCSSAIISAYQAAGVDCGGATYTGNMRRCMTATGNFEWMPMSYIAQRGDIYLNEINHTAMCTSPNPDTLAEFAISETGGIDGADGDQTGWESIIKPYYDYPWDGILRYTGKADNYVPAAPAAKPAQNAGTPMNNNGLLYKGHVQNIGDCEVVHDGQICGTTGLGLRLEGLYVDIRKFPGMKLNVYAHIQDIGDVIYKNVQHNTLIGTTGKSKRLEALHFEIEEYGSAKGKKLKFRVHEQDKGWSSWGEEGAFRGSTGESRRIEAVQIVLI